LSSYSVRCSTSLTSEACGETSLERVGCAELGYDENCKYFAVEDANFRGSIVRLIGLAGWSGSGKTTLLAALIPVLISRGYSVSTIKHAHHDFDVDKPGKDSHTHRSAGAQEVLVASDQRWALMHELRGAPAPKLQELVRHLGPADFVLIEGFKREAHPKIEIHRSALGKPLLYPSDDHIVAIASDAPLSDVPLPAVDLNDIQAIADLVEQRASPFAAFA
jgi:molybdopterin-guanine dinucleotide biosynthesis adapter protein